MTALGAGEGYFLYHSIGVIPGHEARLAAELAGFAALWTRPDDGQWPAVLDRRREFIARWGRLIGAPAHTLTTTENVTSGLYSLLGSLPGERLRGKRILVGADCFPSLYFLLSGMVDRLGCALDVVPCREGESFVRDEDVVARWGADVGLALLTWVTSVASYRCDYAALAAHGRRMGSVVVLDITQGVGIVPFSVAGAGIDAVVSTSLKWIGGTAGAGILHVDAELLATCRPELRGWFSQDNPFAWALDGFRYADDARRFDHGTPSALAAIATLPALRWLEDRGVPALREHNLALSEAILAHAGRRGWRVVSPLDPARRGGSVMLRCGADGDGTALVAALRAEGLHCDMRGSVLRLSPGAVTTERGVSALCGALDRAFPA